MKDDTPSRYLNWHKPLLAEFIGTFGLTFIGAGAICTNDFNKGSVGLVGIALAHGLLLACLISALGKFSGGHFNPAVTFGVVVGRKIDAGLAAMYVVAQLLGSMLAGVLLLQIYPKEIWELSHLGTPALAAGITASTGFLVEAVLTFFLVTSVYGTAVDPLAPKLGGFAIGLTVTLDILMGGPITGAGMNPARWFGTAFAAGYWEHPLVYILGPLVGATVAAFLYEYVLFEPAETSVVAPEPTEKFIQEERH